MNLLDHTVTKVLSKPYEKYYKWWVRVECEYYGNIGERLIMFNSKEQAEEVTVGYVFLG
mgnify:FL=1